MASPKFKARRAQNAPQLETQARTRAASGGLDLLALEDLHVDQDTQMRVAMDADVIESYQEKMRAGASGAVYDLADDTWPGLVIFSSPEEGSWLADGFHRFAAAKALGLTHFQVERHVGLKRDAIRYALSANETHGLRRTNADKRLSVERALRDVEWGAYSNGQLAKLTGVSKPTVSKYRAQLESRGQIEEQSERIGTDGQRHEVVAVARRAPAGATAGPWPTGLEDARLDALAKTLHPGSRAPASAPRPVVLVADASAADWTLRHLDRLLCEDGHLILDLEDLDAHLPRVLELSALHGNLSYLILSRSRRAVLVWSRASAQAPPTWASDLGPVLSGREAYVVRAEG